MRSITRRPLAANAVVALLATLSIVQLSAAYTATPAVTLPPLTATERGWVADPHSIPVRARLGFGRAVPEGALAAILEDAEHWRPTDDGGHRLAVRVTSPGAAGLRLGLGVDALPDQATLSVTGSDGDIGAEVLTGVKINASLARDRADRAEAREDVEPLRYWLPLVIGDTTDLEIRLPPGVEPSAVRLRLTRVSHLFALPFTLPGETFGGPTDCHRDVACSDDPLLHRLARATAILLYVVPGGGSNACTGTLLADSDPNTRVPYLITAHHCVPDQRQASTVETYWLHQAERCNGEPTAAPVRVTGGAELFYARKTIDTAFLRLRRPAPAGASFAEWSPTLPEHGTEVVSVHHPQGQPVKMARGEVVAHWHCLEVAYCGEDAEDDGVHYFGVEWSEGLISGGSSGAGAFLAESGALVGVNTGGLSTCEVPAGPDDFGRFDLVYREALRRWLGR